MTRDESLQIVAMILSHWQVQNWSKEEIDVYARAIQHLDAEITTSVVIRSVRELKYAPKIAELHERYYVERRRLRPVVEPVEVKPTPLPQWVKRWICARMLYARFGKERDERRFPEQGDYGDLTRELMPEGAWNDEADKLTDLDIRIAWKEAFKT